MQKWDSEGEALSSSQIHLESKPHLPPLGFALEESNWYAIHTVARHEKRVAAQFEEKRVCTFLPLLRQIHRWSDRRSVVEIPMFSCYAFVRMVQIVEERLKVLRTPGVLGFVGSERQGTQIPEEQIESLRKVIREKLPCLPHPFITFGKRVRICGGSLDGIEGILMREGRDQSLVISVELLQRSVSIRVEGYDIKLA
jgi:transcription antitermination factor NusG